MSASFLNTLSAAHPARSLVASPFVSVSSVVRVSGRSFNAFRQTGHHAALILIRKFKQASSVGGLIATRLLRTGTGSCARFYRNCSLSRRVQPSKQTLGIRHILVRQSPFVSSVRHEQNTSERSLSCVASLMSRVTKCLS